MIGLIAAVSQNGIIGQGGSIPWNYPADLKYFRETTANSTIIMGRLTFESIGRALPKRRNIVISSRRIEMENIETFPTVEAAMDQLKAENQKHKEMFEIVDGKNISIDIAQNIWFIGGSRIYEAGLNYVSEIHLTITPDVVDCSFNNVARFPWINPEKFKIKEWRRLILTDDALKLYIYDKI